MKQLLIRCVVAIAVGLVIFYAVFNKDFRKYTLTCDVSYTMQSNAAMDLYLAGEAGMPAAWYALGERFEMEFMRTGDQLAYLAAANAYNYALEGGMECASTKKGNFPTEEELNRCVENDPGCMYITASFDDYMREETRQLLQKATMRHSPRAAALLAGYYKDMPELERVATRDNDTKQMLWIGRTHLHRGDRQNAEEWLERAAMNGSADAMLDLQQLYNTQDCNKSGYWAKKAMESGDGAGKLAWLMGYRETENGIECAINTDVNLDSLMAKEITALNLYVIYALWEHYSELGDEEKAAKYMNIYSVLTN